MRVAEERIRETMRQTDRERERESEREEGVTETEKAGRKKNVGMSVSLFFAFSVRA